MSVQKFPLIFKQYWLLGCFDFLKRGEPIDQKFQNFLKCFNHFKLFLTRYLCHTSVYEFFFIVNIIDRMFCFIWKLENFRLKILEHYLSFYTFLRECHLIVERRIF